MLRILETIDRNVIRPIPLDFVHTGVLDSFLQSNVAIQGYRLPYICVIVNDLRASLRLLLGVKLEKKDCAKYLRAKHLNG